MTNIPITGMETMSGLIVDLASPDPDSIEIQDIAWHLSRISRYNGATVVHDTYTVAQHSLLVCSLMSEATNAFEFPEALMLALLHDAHEAYTGDDIRPKKKLMDLQAPLKRLEERVQKAVLVSVERSLGLATGGLSRYEDQFKSQISDMDAQALEIEAFNLMRSRGRGWAHNSQASEEKMLTGFHIMRSEQACNGFHRRYLELKSLIRQKEDNRRAMEQTDRG